MDQPPTIALRGRLMRVGVVPGAGSARARGGGAPAGTPQDCEELQEARRLLEKDRGDLKLARQALESGIARLTRLEGEWQHQAQEQIVDLALAIAARVLMQEIRSQRHEIDPIVKAVLARAPSGANVVVRMNPEDLARCEMAAGAAQPASGSGDSPAAPLRYLADSTLQRAECVVETPQGFVQSDVESHLRELAEALRSSK